MASVIFAFRLTILGRMALSSVSTAPSVNHLSRHAKATFPSGHPSYHSSSGPTALPPANRLVTLRSTWRTASSLSYPSISPWPHFSHLTMTGRYRLKNSSAHAPDSLSAERQISLKSMTASSKAASPQSANSRSNSKAPPKRKSSSQVT